MTKVLYCFILFFLLTSKLFSQNLINFEILGNERISDETIIIFTGLNNVESKNLNDNDLNNIIKKLYATDFFEDVSIKSVNGKLFITVVEYPLVQTVEISGIKNKRIISLLEENIKLREKNSYIPVKIKNDEKIINNILRINGYYFSSINTKIITNQNNTVDIIYDIIKGDKAYIEKIIGKVVDVNAKQWISFSRISFVHKQKKERLTIDIKLSFKDDEKVGNLNDIVIAEVKQERMSRSSDFIRIAKEMSILPIRLSKYCISTMQLWPSIKQNRFKKKLLFINKLKRA